MRIVLNTGSTVPQGEITKGGRKMTHNYAICAAVCFLNPVDFQQLASEAGVAYAGRIRVSTATGETVVYSKRDESVAQGHGFIPRGPWVNLLIPEDSHGTGSPSYKGVEAELVPTSETVKTCSDLVKKHYTQVAEEDEV